MPFWIRNTYSPESHQKCAFPNFPGSNKGLDRAAVTISCRNVMHSRICLYLSSILSSSPSTLHPAQGTWADQAASEQKGFKISLQAYTACLAEGLVGPELAISLAQVRGEKVGVGLKEKGIGSGTWHLCQIHPLLYHSPNPLPPQPVSPLPAPVPSSPYFLPILLTYLFCWALGELTTCTKRIWFSQQCPHSMLPESASRCLFSSQGPIAFSAVEHQKPSSRGS